nr:uncharacterized protein CTRU02_06491 [Colletotrichum truncatum]KAF6792408.1 hypothetical protein CTRU02_06491 [Colletotrichum truncatum]
MCMRIQPPIVCRSQCQAHEPFRLNLAERTGSLREGNTQPIRYEWTSHNKFIGPA